MRLTQSIHRASQMKGGQLATLCGERRQTWRELGDRVARMASVLQQQGIEPGDRVAILALNSDRYFESSFAIPWAGGVLVPLNNRWSARENIYASNDAGIAVLMVDEHFIEMALKISKEVNSLNSLIYIGEGKTPEGMHNFEALIKDADPVADVGRGYQDLAGIFYTGGTTGFPKGVMLSHQNLVSNALCNLSSLDVNRPDIIYLHAAPMFHLADIAISLANTLNGNTHAFIEGFSTAGFIRAVEQYAVTDALLIPTMVSMLLKEPLLTEANFSSLRTVYYGASPMTEGTLIAAMEKLPGVAFYQAYGQTELSPVVTVLKPEYHCLEGKLAGKTRSAGQCNIACEIKIVDEQGNTLPVGQVGEIAATGPNAMLGYWNNPEQTAKALLDGWVLTGDAGYLDEDGFLFLVDRKKDMIVSGGENVFSAEVENAVSLHPAVHEVVVIGIPSEKWGEAVHAVVRLNPSAAVTENEIISFCKQHIAGYKCPQSVDFWDQPFPVTGAGKIRKADIREPYWKNMKRKVN